MAFPSSRPYLPRLNENGFTLLELLIVVFILASLAFSTISLTTNADEQFRFEDTRTRLSEIRRVIIGDPTRTLNGEPAISGFVADMGRLPNNVQELIEPGTLALWALDPLLDLWGGWRGPYLSTLSETGGAKAYRDGWGNADATPNYGWSPVTVNQTAGTIDIKSLGSDGVTGSTDPNSTYDDDYPPVGFLIEQSDHQLNIQGWTINVVLNNNNTGVGSITVEKNKFRIRLYYPQDGSFVWTDCTDAGFPWPGGGGRESASYLSSKFPPADININNGDTASLSVSFVGNTSPKWVPWGVHALGIVNDKNHINPEGCPYDPAPSTIETYPRVKFLPRTQIPTSMTLTWDLK